MGSWKDIVDDNNRCIFFEVENDRALRCGCFKYINIDNDGSMTFSRGNQKGFSPSVGGNFFDLCGGTDEYVSFPGDNQEEEVIIDNDKEIELLELLNCHLDRTDPFSSPDFSACIPDEPSKSQHIPRFKVQQQLLRPLNQFNV